MSGYDPDTGFYSDEVVAYAEKYNCTWLEADCEIENDKKIEEMEGSLSD